MTRMPPPAGPSTPGPPRNPVPLPRPAPPPPQPRPGRAVMSNFTGLVLAFAAVSISAGLALIVAPPGHTASAWNMPTGLKADLLLVPLFVVFLFVSLALQPPGRRRHLPAAVGAGTGVGSVLRGAEPTPANSPKRPAVSASASG